jgi:hypothetical protein
VTQKITKKFANKVYLQIYETNSDYARACNIKASICLFIDDEKIPIQVALSFSKMQNYLREKLN